MLTLLIIDVPQKWLIKLVILRKTLMIFNSVLLIQN